MIRINLAPQENIEQLNIKTKNAKIGVIAGFAVLIIAVTGLMKVQATLSAEIILKEKLAELQGLQTEVEKVRQLEKAESEIAGRLKIVSELLSSKYTAPYFMRKISDTIGGAMWVESISTNNISPTKIKFSIRVNSYSGNQAAQWMSAIEKDKHFSAVSLGPMLIKTIESENSRIFSFPLDGIYEMEISNAPAAETKTGR